MTYWKLFIANNLHLICGFILIPLIGVTVDSYKHDANYLPTLFFVLIEVVLFVSNYYHLQKIK